MSTPETENLLAFAVAAGLVTAREAADGAVTLRGSTLLLHERPVAYVRHSTNRETSVSVVRELSCLRLLRDTGLVPDVLAGSTGNLLWTAAVSGIPLHRLRGTMAELADACQTWGSALAALHLTALGAGTDPPVASRPWLLDLDRAPEAMRSAPSGSARAFVLRTLRSDRGLLRCVDRLADRWSADHWIHGDLTEGRVLLRHAPDLRVCFVDLRHGGLGDAGWDLAGALETLMQLTAGRSAPWGTASGACLSEYLVQGYRRSGGLASVDAGTRALRILARAWDAATRLDARADHPASMHPAAGYPHEATRLGERLATARELAQRSARPGLVAA